MARVNVYLPADLAEQVRAAELNVSALAQNALRAELGLRRTDDWLDRVGRLQRVDVPHETVLDALDAARDDFGHWPE